MDINLAIQLKEDLQKNIKELLRKYEDMVDLKIEVIKVNRAIASGKIFDIEVKVELRR